MAKANTPPKRIETKKSKGATRKADNVIKTARETEAIEEMLDDEPPTATSEVSSEVTPINIYLEAEKEQSSGEENNRIGEEKQY